MFRHYLKAALRSAIKNRYFTAINIAGLAVATGCCLVLCLYVFHELTYDDFHANHDRIYRVTMEFGEGESNMQTGITGTRTLPEFLRSFPEIENGVRFHSDGAIVKHENNSFIEERFVHADSTFFQVFTFDLLEGDPTTALDEPNSVILTASMSRNISVKLRPSARHLTSIVKQTM